MALESLENQSGNLPTAGSSTQDGMTTTAATTQQAPIVTSGLSDWYQTNLKREADPEGLQYWSERFGETLDPNEINILQQSPEYQNRQFLSGLYLSELGREYDDPGMQYWMDALSRGASRADIQRDFNLSPEGAQFDTTPASQISTYYQDYLNRAPDVEGLNFWANAAQSGVPLEQIRADIARSEESKGLRAGELSGLFVNDFGEDFANTLTEDEMRKFTDIYSDITAQQQYTRPVSESEFDREFYLRNNPDVARNAVYGSNPYQHYLDHGFNEYMSGQNPNRLPNAAGPGTMTADQRYLEVMKQAALDPELGAIIKAKDPFLFESLTPLTYQHDKIKQTERIGYGQYGTYNIDGVDVPILNAKRADQLLGRDGYGEVSDFSHGRGNLTRDLGWTSNSFSNKIARGAQAIGVTASGYGDQIYYQGLEDAAKLVGIDASQFKDKQIQATQKADVYNEYGQLIAKAGDPIFQTDEYGNVIRDWQTGEPTPVMETVSRDQQLYDAINEAAKDIYLYTGDSLTPGRATEGGGQSFDTVLYKRVGDELIPLTKPTSHGGYQNLDVYTGGSGFNFGRDIAPGLIFVGGAALAWTGAGALATSLGNTLAGAVGATVSKGTASIIGGIAIGAATGALTAAATGTDIGQGALKGGVAGGVGAGMPQVLGNLPGMGSVVSNIASSLNLNPADVGSVISSTLSRTLSTAAAGANGDQILNSFTTALASTTLGAAGANAVKSVFADSFTPSQLAGMARATQLVTNAAASSVISGGSTEQVANSVINSLVSNAGSIQQAADKAKTAGFTKAELDALNEGAKMAEQSGQPKYYELASTITSDQPTPLVSKDSISTSLYDSKYWDPESGSWKAVPTSEGGGGDGISSSSTGTTAQVNEVPSSAELKKEFEQGTLPSAGEINKQLAEGAISQKVADAYLQAIGQYNPETPDFSKIDDSLNLAISLTVGLIGNGADTKSALDNVSKATGIDSKIISQAINSTKKTSQVSDGTGVTGTDGSGAGVTGATGPTGATGTEGTGAGTAGTGPTGGFEGEGEGTGTGGEGVGVTGVTGGTGATGATGGTGSGGGGGSGNLPSLPKIPTISQITAARRVATDDMDGIYNLMPGYTKGKTDYELAGRFKMADGGSVSQYDPFGMRNYSDVDSGIYDASKSPFIGSDIKMPKLTVGLTDAVLDYVLPGLMKFAEGGSVPGGHNPQFFSEGGLNTLENRYVNGEGDGTSDSVPAMLANGEFVIPADVVSSLGNGSNEAGANVLDEFLQVIREHKQKHDAKKLPPDSKGALAYLLDAKKRA